MKAETVKANGVHYTPPALAEFLAEVTAAEIHDHEGDLEVLDPACGDGALLGAFAERLPPDVLGRTTLIGFETDTQALLVAKRRLTSLGLKALRLFPEDFLDSVGHLAEEPTLFDLDPSPSPANFCCDVIIANPPYVRTQVLGSAKARVLAKKFQLTGRVDLHHAFTKAMALTLRPGGVLGLLTSNRLLTVRSGVAVRRLLHKDFLLRHIYDLGDTKLFSAAVLPVIVVAKKHTSNAYQARKPFPSASAKPAHAPESTLDACMYDRIYTHRSGAMPISSLPTFPTPLHAIKAAGSAELVHAAGEVFSIERGTLSCGQNGDVWTLSNQRYRQFIEQVHSRRLRTFDEVSRIRVGIKTTADDVFIRDDWSMLPSDDVPEPELIRPLIRHFDAQAWSAPACLRHSVLYPHTTSGGRRQAIDLDRYPKARRYLESFQERLVRRHYVTNSGRQWYEIWVPHDPSAWQIPKVVFPDISETPKFFLDRSGAIVNGDCYWITLRPGYDQEWLLLILAVANSTFITKYYDLVFHNKLYAGRRRFMTQYVKQFPLPDIDGPISREIVGCAGRILEKAGADTDELARIDGAVWAAFGVSKEGLGQWDL